MPASQKRTLKSRVRAALGSRIVASGHELDKLEDLDSNNTNIILMGFSNSDPRIKEFWGEIKDGQTLADARKALKKDVDDALKDATVDEGLIRIGLDIFHAGSIFVTGGDTNVMAVDSWIPEWKKTLKSGSTSNLNIVSPDFYDHPNMNLVDMLIDLSRKIRPGWPRAFEAGIAAALHRPAIGRELFFKGDEYLQYIPRKRVEHVLTIANAWTGWPDHFERGIDAALARPSSNKEYFFKGDEYIRYTPMVGMDRGHPKKIAKGWTGWPDRFEQGIDAALARPSSNKEYFFKGDEFIRYTPMVGMDSGFPMKIAKGWTGWPDRFEQGIDAALARPSSNKEYFFKGDEYIRCTPGVGMDRGYPKKIVSRWG